ncbi:hypothetical protein ElyMa_001253500 [Elysia marginata]|uniref:Uncharacterized protein n=1 Tax=Elysia marginata TaxID=1093978 RepID=A0AAV4IAY3_9GAST|nr:hypothetical protein ElyMa_001253500 [Elysia marginata]
MFEENVSQGLHVDLPNAGLEPQISRSQIRASTTRPQLPTRTYERNTTQANPGDPEVPRLSGEPAGYSGLHCWTRINHLQGTVVFIVGPGLTTCRVQWSSLLDQD